MTSTPKPTWPTVAFGDVVKLNRDRIANPVAEGVERYLGIEHIEPEDLRIRRWGLVAEGTTFTNAFQPGQVLFVKRRAYQRKVAVADFAGVCSGDIYVLESKDPDVLLPELLPFICQTEGFFEHAVGTSAGSLSPRTNWTQLAAYEFALPPLAEQRRIADVLGAVEDFIEELRSAELSTANLYTALLENFISKVTRRIPFREILVDASYGSSTRASSDGKGIPILRIPNILRNEIDLSDLKWVKLSINETDRYALRGGDILIVRTNGNPDYVGRCVVVNDPPKPLVYASYLIRLRVNKKFAEPEYISTVINAPTSRHQLRASVRSSAGNYNLNTKGIGNQIIPLPEIWEQQELVVQLSSIETTRQTIKERFAQSIQLKQQILADLGG